MLATLNPGRSTTPADCPEHERRASVRFVPGPRVACDVCSRGNALRGCRVLNLSQDGIRLLLGRRVRPGEMLEVRLSLPGQMICFAVWAEVMYAHQRDKGDYVVGAAFRRPLSPRLLAMLG